MNDQQFRLEVFENYLSLIRGIAGCNMFRHLYVSGSEGKNDITENGNLSCAYVVSSVLRIVGWISRPHATVKSTLRDMSENGWRQVVESEPGAVVLWPSNENMPEHLGFYLHDDQYVSNDSSAGTPQIHGRNMRDGREPEAYFVRDFNS